MTVVDVSPKTYAEMRDRLRQDGNGEDVGNKLIHLHEVALREEEGASEQKGAIVYIAFFAAFAAALIWLVTRIWR